MNRKIVGLFAMLLLFAILSQVTAQETEEKVEFGWYEVAPWEIEFCSSWGGLFDPDQAQGGEASGSMQGYTSMDIIATLQAEAVEVAPGEITLPENTQVFQISWYMQPVVESVDYSVTAFYRDGSNRVVLSGSATPFSNYDGFDVEQTEKNMTEVVLSVPSKSIELRVPVVK